MVLGTTFRKHFFFATFLIASLLTVNARAAIITISPDDSVSFASTNGAQVTKTITVTNTGMSPLTGTITLSGDNAFRLNGLGVLTLTGMGSQDIAITYAPTVGGSNNATLTVAANGEVETVTLLGSSQISGGGNNNGSVRSTSELNFNSVIVGQSQCSPVTLANSSLGLVTFSNAHLEGDTSQFHLSNTSNVNVLANGTGSVTVCYMPTVGQQEAHARLVLDYASALDSTVRGSVSTNLNGTARAMLSDSSFDITDRVVFSNVQVGTQNCQNVNIVNSTNSSIHVDSAYVMGNGSASAGTSQFSLTANGASTLGAHTTSSYTICFTPTEAQRSADYFLVIRYSDSTGSIRGTLRTLVDATSEFADSTAESNACIQVRHSGGVLGPIVSGGNATGSIMLTNRSAGDVTITGATLSGSDAGAFTVSNNFPVTITSGSTATLNVGFAPQASMGNQVSFQSTATLATTGSTCGNVNIHLVGVSLPFHDTTHVDLGSNIGGNIGIQGNGGMTLDTIQLINTTGGPITVTSITLRDTTNGNFHVVGTTTPLPTTIQAGGNLGVIVSFNAGTPGYFTNQLQVNTAGSITPTVVNLQAVQAAPAFVKNNMTNVDFTVAPNPTRGQVKVTLTGVHDAKVQVLDLLGRVVTEGTAGSTWTWNGMDQTNTLVSNGAYVVRVSGLTSDGKEFRVSRQFAMEH